MDKVTKWFVRTSSLIIILLGIGYISKPFSNKLKNYFPEKIENLQNNFEVIELTDPSPSLSQVENLLNTWLREKSKILSGSSKDLSETVEGLTKIVDFRLLDRTLKSTKFDIDKKQIRTINYQIEKIDLLSQTSSRIVVLVELNYLEKLLKDSGEVMSEIFLNPLKVKYILGLNNDSWKLVDFISLD